MKKRLIASILALIMAVALSVPAMAAEKKFTDVKEGQWYYSYVMHCAQKGLVSGTGNNIFNPSGTLTKSQFFTIIVRYMYPNEIKNYNGDKSEWWTMYCNIAKEKGLYTDKEYTEADLGTAMTRQEMALVISRALAERGETPDMVVPTSAIPDYSTIGTYYRDAVRVVYTAGIISGQTGGVFNPKGNLSRAEACTVMYRFTEPQTRSVKEGTDSLTGTTVNQGSHQEPGGQIIISTGPNASNSSWNKDNRFTPGATAQEWVEGQAHNEPRVGDVVIKADGTRVVLEAATVNGREILGISPTTGPQGVDPYTGWGTHKVGSLSDWDAGTLLKDPVTGSVFSSREWKSIEAVSHPDYKGQKDGEVSTNGWFSWDADMGLWDWIGPWK